MPSDPCPSLYLLGGPTAVGKTALALAWAETHNAVILSADALLFYHGMDLGTAKPTPAERRRVPHYGLDLVPVRQAFSVGAYVTYIRRLLARWHARGQTVLVVGGSGFYLKAFVAAVTDATHVPLEVRQRVTTLRRSGGTEALWEALVAANTGTAPAVDRRNPRRLENALMRAWATGQRPDDLRNAMTATADPFPQWRKHLTFLTRPRAELHDRIAARTEAMLAAGWEAETRQLLALGLRANPTAARAIGYREMIAWLDGALPREELPAAINAATRRLVRKQETWRRHQMPGGHTLELTAAAQGDPDTLFPPAAALDLSSPA